VAPCDTGTNPCTGKRMAASGGEAEVGGVTWACSNSPADALKLRARCLEADGGVSMAVVVAPCRAAAPAAAASLHSRAGDEVL